MKARAASLPALPMACGALVAVLAFHGRSWLEYTLLALALAASTLTAYYGVRRSASYFILGLLGGILSCFINRVPDIPRNLLDGDKTTYRFELMRVGEGAKGLLCLGKAVDTSVPFRAYITVTDKALTLLPGDIIETYGQADDIFHTSELPFMESEALSARCDAASAKLLVPSDDIRIIGRSDSFRYRMLSLRDRLAYSFYQSDLPPDVSALIASVCLGTADTPVSVKERFRAGGIAHLLCVSGFHVGVVAWLTVILLWPLRLWSRAGRIRYLLTILIVWLYVALIGFTPSAIRAAVMLSAYYTGRLLQRGASSFNSLALAFAILLLIQPRWLYSVGMQLSVCAVLGILIFADRLNPTTQRHQALYRLCVIFTVPLAAILGTAPILLCRFHTLPLLTVVTNAFATLLFAPFMIAGSIAVVINSLGVPIGWLSSILSFIYNIIVRLCSYSTPENILSGIYLSDFMLVLLVSGIILFAILLHANRRNVRVAACVAIVAVCGLSACQESPAHGNEIIVAGNRTSTELIIRDGGKGYTLAISNAMSNFSYLNDYFAGYGIPADSITRNPTAASLEIRGIAIATRHPKYRLIRPADYLIVDGSYSGDTDETISAVRPQFAVLSANIPAARTLEWEKTCKENGVTVMRLGEKALRIKL